jgi:predicted alpha/beta-fold hydrolase
MQFERNQSCYYVVKDIKIPTLFIHSMNDPVCIKECLPIKAIKKNGNCILVLTQKGGHIEWFTGRKPERWAYKVTLEFLTY